METEGLGEGGEAGRVTLRNEVCAWHGGPCFESALKRQRQEDLCEFLDSQKYMERPYTKKIKINK